MKPPASTVWLNESNEVGDEEVAFQDRWRDPDTGIAILRLTSQPCLNEHIYPEHPASTPDGRRFVFARTPALSRHTTYWIADLETHAVRQITDEPKAVAPVITPDGKEIYYSVGRAVWRLSPDTFEREACFVFPAQFSWVGGIRSVSHDGTRLLTAARGSSGLFGVAALEVATGRAWMVFEGPDVRNAHPQYSRNPDNWVMVQINDGIVLDEHDNILRLVGELGASLVVVGDDGRAPIRLNIGASMRERVQGHQCWLGAENRVISTLHVRESPASPWVQDRIVTIAPGEAAPRLVAQGEGFTHIHTTPDGRFWVADCNRTARIFVGSLRTGRHGLFCGTGATFGAAQYTHPHPFFIGDGRAIGWNSDATGVPHIYCATVPEAFLVALER
jgi:hypothetical protein